MKLQVYCKSCFKKFNLKENASSRKELSQLVGEYFHKSCPKCGTPKEYHVNSVKAVETAHIPLTILAVIIGIIFTLLFFVIGFISTIGLAIGGLIMKAAQSQADKSEASYFNNNYIQTTARKRIIK